MSFNAKVLVELKTTTDASYDFFLKRRLEHEDYRYDLQLSFYKHGIESITGRQVELAAFVVIESEPPFEAAVYEIPDNLIDLAKFDMMSNMRKIKNCLEENKWPPMQHKTQYMFPSDYNVGKNREGF